MWLRGGIGEQGVASLNFQSVGMLPWMQQRLDPSLLQNEQNQQYQAMIAAGMQSGDPLRQQSMQFQQQPLQYLQQTGGQNSLLPLKHLQHQQAVQQSIPQNVLEAQSQILTDSTPQHLLQQLHHPEQSPQQHQQQRVYHHDAFQIQGDHLLQRQQSNVPSPSFSKTDFVGSSTEISASMPSIPGEQLPQQSWGSKYADSHVHSFVNPASLLPLYNQKDAALERDNCNSDAQNANVFGINVDSSVLLLPTTVSSFATSVDPDVSTMPLGDSGFQNSLYSCMQDSSELLQNAGQVDQPTPTRTFVKVWVSNWMFNYLCMHASLCRCR